MAHTFDPYEILQLYILPLISYTPMNVDFDIVVHLRAGDTFNPFYYDEQPYAPVHPGFVQSPPSYFYKILSIECPKKILIVAEDKSNPNVDELLQSKYDCSYEPRSIIEDINLILNCKKLVIGGTSSFSMMLAKIC